jgi:hypothetical protein
MVDRVVDIAGRVGLNRDIGLLGGSIVGGHLVWH